MEILQSHRSGAKESGEMCVHNQSVHTSRANDQDCSKATGWVVHTWEGT